MNREELVQLRDAIDLTLALPDSHASFCTMGEQRGGSFVIFPTNYGVS